jgi:CheY-like chemotaxis protein
MAGTAVIVDDHAEFLAVAGELLEAAGWQVVGSCPDGRSALTAISELRPDLLLLDVQLPDIDGFEVIARIDQTDGPMVALVSTRDADDYGSRVDSPGRWRNPRAGALAPARDA